MTSRTHMLLLAGVVQVAVTLFGCASAPSTDKRAGDERISLDLSKIYLLVTNECSSPVAIVESMEKSTVFALVQNNRNVKIVKDLDSVGDDGVLLRVAILSAFRGGTSKQIAIEYQVVDNATKAVITTEKDALGSKFGYGKITVALGKRIAARVGTLTGK